MENYVETNLELDSFFQVQEKVKACRNSKLNFSSSCFIADDSHVKIVLETAPCTRFEQT